MAYRLAVSSGLWGIEKGGTLLGISKKIEWATTKGVDCVQVDLENVTEFKEPFLKEKLERIKKLNVEFGFHGESLAMSGGFDVLPLGSALHSDYVRAHDRLITHVEEAGNIGAKFVTIHTVESHPFIMLGRELQPADLVDFWGRSLKNILSEHDNILEWAIQRQELHDIGYWHDRAMNRFHQIKEAYDNSPDERKGGLDLEKEKKKILREKFMEYFSTSDMSYGHEMVAYYVVAKYMMATRDPIWMAIVKKMLSDDDLFNLVKSRDWVPAVAAKYIWGHFMPERCPTKIDYKDIKPSLEKYRMYFSFETPMASHGYEGHVRLAHLPHIYAMCKNIDSKWVGFTMDMEHLLGCNIDPEKDIKNLPDDGGKYLRIVHITRPTPMNPSHLPIAVGSEDQDYIYRRLWELRQKGFTDGWIVFERGGGEDPVKQTVIAMRIIKNFLEREVKPEDLPLEFWGMKPEGPEIARQKVTIMEHMMDPIKNLLVVPEEEYTFLSSKAVEKGKTQEYGKEKYR